MTKFYINIPKETTSNSANLTVQNLDNYYTTNLPMPAGAFDALKGFFEGNGFGVVASETIAHIIFYQAEIDGYNPLQVIVHSLNAVLEVHWYFHATSLTERQLSTFELLVANARGQFFSIAYTPHISLPIIASYSIQASQAFSNLSSSLSLVSFRSIFSPLSARRFWSLPRRRNPLCRSPRRCA